MKYASTINKSINLFLLLIMLLVFLFFDKIYAIETVIRVALDSNLPPYQFIDNGECIGMHIDILNYISNKNNFLVQFIPMDNNIKCMNALKNGKVDMILGIKNNIKFNGLVQFTESISQSSICIIASKEKSKEVLSEMGRRKFIAVLEDDTIKYSIIQNMNNFNYLVSSNQTRAFNSFINDKMDMLIAVKHCALYLLEDNEIEDDYIILNNYIAPIEYAIAINKDNEELLNIINAGLNQIRISGEYEKIHNKWVNEDKYVIKGAVKRIVKIISIVLIVITIVFIFNFRLNLLLKEQVNKKTKELQVANKDLQLQVIETRNHNEIKNCIVENSHYGIIAFDIQNYITLFNKHIITLIGVDTLSLGENIYKIQFFKDILNDKKDKVFLNGSKYINEKAIYKSNENQDVIFRYSLYPLFNFDSSIRGAILTIEDITNEIRAKEKAFDKEKNNALNQIIAGMAHEIRNPLMSIKTFIELIPRKIGNIEFEKQLIEFVPKEVERVCNLIAMLLDYAKPKASERRLVSIGEIINSCIALLEPIIESKLICIDVAIEEQLLINVDINQIKQAIINIMLNGFESMDIKISKGMKNVYCLKMYIIAWQSDGFAYIQIKDEGIGMNQIQIKKSVEPFYTTKSKGTGLGLSLSYQYIKENNGTLKIESKKGKHTIITMRFEV